MPDGFGANFQDEKSQHQRGTTNTLVHTFSNCKVNKKPKQLFKTDEMGPEMTKKVSSSNFALLKPIFWLKNAHLKFEKENYLESKTYEWFVCEMTSKTHQSCKNFMKCCERIVGVFVGVFVGVYRRSRTIVFPPWQLKRDFKLSTANWSAEQAYM